LETFGDDHEAAVIFASEDYQAYHGNVDSITQLKMENDSQRLSDFIRSRM
jgi:ADP-dependent phosphofructokinase/glucokinase